MRFIFYIICVAIYIASFFTDVTCLGISDSSEFYTMFTYIFTHKNIIHLAANIICIELMHAACEKEFWKYMKFSSSNILFMTFMAFAIISGVLASQPKVTIGASGIAYAYTGFILSCVLKNNTRFFIDTLVFLIFANVVSYVCGMNNFLVHMYPCVMGFIFHRGLIYVRRRSIKNNRRE